MAVSRARDRVVLVRSVKREELNPIDLKARLIAHFENPMPEVKVTADALGACESVFERDVMSQLLERGYRVQAQVGSLGYRIDMVAEGANGARLAIECDGDRYHGPEQWRQDMNRQRVLERVGWRFWRCFASSFYRDTEAVVKDLIDALSRMGIEPAARDDGGTRPSRYTEHRVVAPEPPAVAELAEAEEFDLRDEPSAPPIPAHWHRHRRQGGSCSRTRRADALSQSWTAGTTWIRDIFPSPLLWEKRSSAPRRETRSRSAWTTDASVRC